MFCSILDWGIWVYLNLIAVHYYRVKTPRTTMILCRRHGWNWDVFFREAITDTETIQSNKLISVSGQFSKEETSNIESLSKTFLAINSDDGEKNAIMMSLLKINLFHHNELKTPQAYHCLISKNISLHFHASFTEIEKFKYEYRFESIIGLGISIVVSIQRLKF